MLQQYIKQAWVMMKQNRFYSTIYILATGLSVSMIMVLAIIFYLKVSNIYPEMNRDRTLIVRYGSFVMPDGTGGTSRLSLETVKQCIYSLKTAEAVTAIYEAYGEVSVQPDNSPEHIPGTVKFVDTGFWKVFTFSFQEGKPFTEADMESGIKTVVVSESYARKIFGTTEVTGKYISINFEPYRICGVVKDVSFAVEKTYANIWMPYSAAPNFNPGWPNGLGFFAAYALAPSKGEMKKVKEEIVTNFNRYASTIEGMEFTVNGQPDPHWLSIFRLSNRQDIDATKILMQYALLFLLFLLIPSVSLSGIADSQLERRLSEMGIRRTFGAVQGGLMKQLVTENLVLTFMGGLAGLLFSYLLVYFFRKWIIHIGTGQVFVSAVPEGVDVALSPAVMMNFTIFAVALLLCLVMNMMITVIPAWRASRREIVYSLNNK